MASPIIKTFKSRGEWLEARRLGIGGSDIAAVAGLTKWRGALAIYCDKRGLVAFKPMSEHQRWGLIHEPRIAAEFARHTGLPLTRCQRTLYIHPEHEWAICTPDFIIDSEAILEVKTGTSWANRDFGKTGTDQVPMEYLAQCVWQLGITGRKLCHLAVLIDGWDYRTYEIPFERELWDMLLADARDLWENHILIGNPPEPDHLGSTGKLLAEIFPKVKEPTIDQAEPDEGQWLDELSRIREMKKKIEQREELAKNRLKASIGDREGIEGGGKKATWIDNSNGTRVFRFTEANDGE